MKIKVGKYIFGFILMLFTLRLLAMPTVLADPSYSVEQDQLNPLHDADKSPLKLWLGEISSTNENETEKEESKEQASEHDYLAFFNHQLSTQFDPAVGRHHYGVNSRDLSHQTALYISFCVYRI